LEKVVETPTEESVCGGVWAEIKMKEIMRAFDFNISFDLLFRNFDIIMSTIASTLTFTSSAETTATVAVGQRTTEIELKTLSV